ncbi:MAG: hypothetical protein ACOZD0_06745 [Pseudomonadota bacterium]
MNDGIAANRNSKTRAVDEGRRLLRCSARRLASSSDEGTTAKPPGLKEVRGDERNGSPGLPE